MARVNERCFRIKIQLRGIFEGGFKSGRDVDCFSFRGILGLRSQGYQKKETHRTNYSLHKYLRVPIHLNFHC